MRRVWFAGSISIGLVLLCGAARAQSGDSALAETLFQEGKRLMAERRFPEACQKLAESQRLDPAGGTLITLALCHEDEGRTASAWAEFSDALAQARRDGRSDRETVAKQHIALLEPKLSRLTITVDATTAAIPGLEVRRTGVVLGKAAWGVASPVDPGEITIEARAPGYRAISTKVVIGKNADAKSVAIPALERAPEGASPGKAPATSVAGDDKAVGSGSGRTTIGWVALSAGAVFLGAGSYFGLRAISKAKDANDACPERTCANEDARTKASDAGSAATLSNIGFGVGLLGVGVGTYLLLTSGGSGQSPRTGRIVTGPTISQTEAGWNLAGRF